MIRHIVLVRFRPDISQDQRQALFAELAALKALIPGTQDFVCGANISPEEPVTHDFNDGFWFDFDTAVTRDAYLIDERHKKIGAKLVSAAEGGLSGIQVFDIEI